MADRATADLAPRVGRRRWLSRAGALLAVPVATGGVGCTRSSPPLRIGLLSMGAGRAVLASEEARNGTVLAVDASRLDGKRSPRLDLVIQTDDGTVDGAGRALEALAAEGAQVVVGAVISQVAQALLPRLSTLSLPLLTTTALSGELAGRDDLLFRLHGSTHDYASAYVAPMLARGWRRVSLLRPVDPRAAAYTNPWRDAFVKIFLAAGGQVVADLGFEDDRSPPLSAHLQKALDAGPDALVLVGASFIIVRMAQQARKLAPQMPLIGSEGAPADSVVELGGASVDGLWLAELFDRQDRSPPYLAFQQAYRERFGRAGGYHAIAAYEAVQVAAQAQAGRRSGETLGDAILRIGRFDGLQRPIVFDRWGDAPRPPSFVVVRDGRLQPGL